MLSGPVYHIANILLHSMHHTILINIILFPYVSISRLDNVLMLLLLPLENILTLLPLEDL